MLHTTIKATMTGKASTVTALSLLRMKTQNSTVMLLTMTMQLFSS